MSVMCYKPAWGVCEKRFTFSESSSENSVATNVKIIELSKTANIL